MPTLNCTNSLSLSLPLSLSHTHTQTHCTKIFILLAKKKETFLFSEDILAGPYNFKGLLNDLFGFMVGVIIGRSLGSEG